MKAGGEPAVPMLKEWYLNEPTAPLPLPEYLCLTRSLEKYQAEFQKYWKSTEMSTISSTPVDGVIMPVCANAACYENTLTYFGK
jgi:hypothetical protein